MSRWLLLGGGGAIVGLWCLALLPWFHVAATPYRVIVVSFAALLGVNRLGERIGAGEASPRSGPAWAGGLLEGLSGAFKAIIFGCVILLVFIESYLAVCTLSGARIGVLKAVRTYLSVLDDVVKAASIGLFVVSGLALLVLLALRAPLAWRAWRQIEAQRSRLRAALGSFSTALTAILAFGAVGAVTVQPLVEHRLKAIEATLATASENWRLVYKERRVVVLETLAEAVERRADIRCPEVSKTKPCDPLAETGTLLVEAYGVEAWWRAADGEGGLGPAPSATEPIPRLANLSQSGFGYETPLASIPPPPEVLSTTKLALARPASPRYQILDPDNFRSVLTYAFSFATAAAPLEIPEGAETYLGPLRRAILNQPLSDLREKVDALAVDAAVTLIKDKRRDPAQGQPSVTIEDLVASGLRPTLITSAGNVRGAVRPLVSDLGLARQVIDTAQARADAVSGKCLSRLFDQKATVSRLCQRLNDKGRRDHDSKMSAGGGTSATRGRRVDPIDSSPTPGGTRRVRVH